MRVFKAAVTVRSLQAKGLIRRAVILDWDVHHGDGTQKIFYEDDSVLYISLHRWDNGKFFPGTGRLVFNVNLRRMRP